jgi:hypothetical protein
MTGGMTLKHSSLFKFTLLLNSVIFWKRLDFKFLLSIQETFVCSAFTPQVKIIILLNVGPLMYLKPSYLNHIL